MRLNQREVTETNKILCEEFGQVGTVMNEGNLNFAVDQFNEGEITKVELCRKIVQGHCFLDANKRTIFVLYLYLTKIENSKNPLVVAPFIGLNLTSYTKNMLKREPWKGWLKLLSEL